MKNETPLTKQQQQLAEQWMPLAHKLARRHKVDVAVLWVALCKAVRSYDPARGYGVQALIQRCMGNAACDEYRKAKSRPREVPIADRHINLAEHVQPCREWVPPPEPVQRAVRPSGTTRSTINRRAKEQGWSRPAHRPRVLDEAAVISALTINPGATQLQIAQALGVSRATLWRCLKSAHALSQLRRVAKSAKRLAQKGRCG